MGEAQRGVDVRIEIAPGGVETVFLAIGLEANEGLDQASAR